MKDERHFNAIFSTLKVKIRLNDARDIEARRGGLVRSISGIENSECLSKELIYVSGEPMGLKYATLAKGRMADSSHWLSACKTTPSAERRLYIAFDAFQRCGKIVGWQLFLATDNTILAILLYLSRIF